MQVHALEMDDFCEEEYSLIGIHSTLEDYKLAYLLNKNLNTRFYKAKENLEFVIEEKKASFSIYNYENKEYDYDWFLIANSYRRENQTAANQLLLTLETKTYLIPEKKKVDFFLKICGDLEYEFVLKTINSIKNIDNVITAFSIDKNTLKSKDFLIF
ncbi:IPExxxVDY family protein [Polaribacter sp. Z014]|uniref:IPExxxVDY family protein n=1 Tax=unclassified Polaribacter TaxID=196858 RepID=UPI00193B52A3|nr:MULTISPECIES: IPExxxVDY family protein [unclassified Polaribacter]MCL7762095.1 IPExxxVDY family protein [Polaribacter sp. Z014]QVY64475.1 IPExxxVDY family protein [Polaribacter sp. Q13]